MNFGSDIVHSFCFDMFVKFPSCSVSIWASSAGTVAACWYSYPGTLDWYSARANPKYQIEGVSAPARPPQNPDRVAGGGRYPSQLAVSAINTITLITLSSVRHTSRAANCPVRDLSRVPLTPAARRLPRISTLSTALSRNNYLKHKFYNWPSSSVKEG